MDIRSTLVAIAAFLTVVDAAVLIEYGGFLWKAFAGLVFARILLVLIFALLIMTLLRVWYRAWCALRPLPKRLPAITGTQQAGLVPLARGESDV
jgi:hypothetical protein